MHSGLMMAIDCNIKTVWSLCLSASINKLHKLLKLLMASIRDIYRDERGGGGVIITVTEREREKVGVGINKVISRHKYRGSSFHSFSLIK